MLPFANEHCEIFKFSPFTLAWRAVITFSRFYCKIGEVFSSWFIGILFIFFFFFLPFIIFSFYISWCIFGESPLDCPLVDWWWSTSPWLSRYFSWFLFTVMPSILPRLLLFLCFWFYFYPSNYLKSNPKSPSFISLQLVGIIISYFAVLITLPSWRRGRTWPDMKRMHFLLLLFLLL